MQYSRNGAFSSRRRRLRLTFNKTVLVSKFLKLTLFGIIGGIVLFFLYFLWISRDLPTPGKLSAPDIKDSTKIMDKNGTILYSIYKDYNRLYVPLDQIPRNLRDATIATEDQDFYSHQGFSIRGYARVVKDLILHGRVTGGSTITQQLVKTVLLTPERRLQRKIKEFFLAIQVGQRYNKDQILELYLNNISYGGTAIGVEASANLYFEKHVKELSLAQSAFLAGLPQSPTFYSPFTSTNKGYIGRAQHVLTRMREEGFISKQQLDAAVKDVEGFKFSQKQGNIKAPHFVIYVREQLNKLFGEQMVEKGNLEVTTTLDYDIQKEAEKILIEELDKLKGYNARNGAVVVLDPKTSAILSMVGSKDYFDLKNDGNFNASTSPRQPGSSLKPIMYAAAFERGYTPATMVMDVKTEFPTNVPGQPNYIPENYDGKYRGPMQLRFALGNSINVPAVKMLAKVGIKPVMQKAYDMGIENWKPTDENMKNVGLSLVLGGREASVLEITSAYAVFANEGMKNDVFSITEVKDGRGKTLYKHEDRAGKRVLSEDISYLISHILFDNNARETVFGRNSLLNVPGKTVSAKTGTTDQKRDNWTIGYNKFRVVGVWVGNNNNEPMNPKIASGVTGAAPIWNKVMQHVLKKLPNEEFKKPDTVETIEIDAFAAGLPVDGQGKRTEYFIKGTQPTTVSPIYKKVKLSKHQQGKLANEEEIKRGDYDLKDYIVFSETDPVSTDGENRWQKAIQAWVEQTYKDDPKYRPPTETSDHKYGSDDDKKPSPTPTPGPSTSSTPTPTINATPTLTLTPTPTFTPTPIP